MSEDNPGKRGEARGNFAAAGEHGSLDDDGDYVKGQGSEESFRHAATECKQDDEKNQIQQKEGRHKIRGRAEGWVYAKLLGASASIGQEHFGKGLEVGPRPAVDE